MLRLQSLLAYLVLHRATSVSRQRPAFLLYPDSTEEQARTNLRNLVYLLRKALPLLIRTIRIDRHEEVTVNEVAATE